MSTSVAPPARRRQVPWSSRLWILAAILGAGALYSGFRLIHDNRKGLEALRVATEDRAEEIALVASERLTRIAAERCRCPGTSRAALAFPPSDSTIQAVIADLLSTSALARRDRVIQLDSQSVAVERDGKQIFGVARDTTRPHAAGAMYITPGIGVGSARLEKPFDNLTVTVSIRSHLPMMVLMPVSHDRLWPNGLLVLGTIVVVLAAAGVSRREVQLARARSDFVAGVSHDLRMPLAQILLASETLTLGRERGEADRVSLNGSIVREARRLVTLVENVLLFSRTGAVSLAPHLQPVSVADLFTEVVEAVHLAVEDAGQRIDADAEAGLRVTGDRGLLRQALVNLVDNSLKYGTAGQRIRLAASNASAGRIEIAVDDEGPGIPADKRSMVFEPYERLTRDQSSERTGSGLGLAVVRQIVIACGGTVRIEDATSGGTRVVLSLASAAS